MSVCSEHAHPPTMTGRAEARDFLGSLECQGPSESPCKRLWLSMGGCRQEKESGCTDSFQQSPVPPAAKSECPGVSCGKLWVTREKTVWKNYWKIQSKRAAGRNPVPPVFPEAEEDTVSGQPVSREVQSNVFRGDPLKTPNRGSFDHLKSFTKRRRKALKCLLSSQWELLPDSISGSPCLVFFHLL